MLERSPIFVAMPPWLDNRLACTLALSIGVGLYVWVRRRRSKTYDFSGSINAHASDAYDLIAKASLHAIEMRARLGLSCDDTHARLESLFCSRVD